MRCVHCGEEMAPQQPECPHCRQPQSEVKVLTPEERESFQGVTLEDESAEKRHFEYESGGPSHRVYVKQMTFGSGSVSLWTKLLIMAVFAFLIFVFLPLALIFIVSISLIWFIFKLLRR